jgi:hypothetical protein
MLSGILEVIRIAVGPPRRLPLRRVENRLLRFVLRYGVGWGLPDSGEPTGRRPGQPHADSVLIAAAAGTPAKPI